MEAPNSPHANDEKKFYEYCSMSSETKGISNVTQYFKLIHFTKKFISSELRSIFKLKIIIDNKFNILI